jgi:multiple sugar transport system ATP-binding protein
MAEVRLVDIEKKYGAFLAVPKQSLTIHDGEFLVLLGPSGCGKTTTMRMIAGLEEITSGDMMIDGEKVNNKPPKDRDIAMVFQNYGLYPHMTVRQNIEYPLKLRGMDKASRKKRVQETADKVELGALLDRRPSELSGGQRQRVALARSIVRTPKLFLMDEPLSNLDAKLRVTMRAELKHLHHELGVTTVYVTHDQMEAMTLATRVAVMREGRIDEPGRRHGVWRRVPRRRDRSARQSGRPRRCRAGDPARRAGNRGRCFRADPGQALCAGTDRRQHAGNPARRPHVGLRPWPRRL